MATSIVGSSAILTAIPTSAARAHALMVARDAGTGSVLTSAIVNVYQPGTTTNVTGQLYDDAGAILTQPLSTDAVTGVLSFYMQVAQNVDLAISKVGFTPRIYSNVPLLDDPLYSAVGALSTPGDLLYARAANTPTRLASGPINAVLQTIAGFPVWQTTLAGLTLSSPHFTSPVVDSGGLTVNGNLLTTNGWVSSGAVIAGVNAGDFSANRGNGTGAIFFADSSHYLYWDGSTYIFPTANVTINGALAVTASNSVVFSTGPYSSDWFRNTIAGQGIYNSASGRGGYFGASGLIDYPYGYTYFNSGNTSLPSSTIVGISDFQSLSEKTLEISCVFPGRTWNGTGSYDLFTSVDGAWRFLKAWGGTLTISGTGSSGVVGPGATAVTTSFIINNGDSASMFFYGGYWWCI